MLRNVKSPKTGGQKSGRKQTGDQDGGKKFAGRPLVIRNPLVKGVSEPRAVLRIIKNQNDEYQTE